MNVRGFVRASFSLDKVDSRSTPLRAVSQVRDRQVVQSELLEVTFKLARQQIGVLNYKVVGHRQQLSDEGTTARQHEHGVVEYAKWDVNAILIRRQRPAHDNVNCLEVVRRRELAKRPAVFEDEPSDPVLYSPKPTALNQFCWAQYLGIEGFAACVLADQCVCLAECYSLDEKAAEQITCPQQQGNVETHVRSNQKYARTKSRRRCTANLPAIRATQAAFKSATSLAHGPLCPQYSSQVAPVTRIRRPAATSMDVMSRVSLSAFRSKRWL